ncbi:hypothetical protein AURDEDRAFT_161055 [Auricularia subglabra TFB-10046 SS5]|nr:hypothetical protein AURDEDRAFT_161055 [Auricularia subglabra TFB-10046 SS5]
MKELLESYPEDLLSLIFDACVALPDEKWERFGFGHYNPARAVLPFYLASVCSRWRQIALRCSKLWTYIGVPGPQTLALKPSNGNNHLRRINLVLFRSARRPIEILFGQPWALHTVQEDNDPFLACFALLKEHTERWGKVEIWTPLNLALAHLAAFRHPMPSLSELSLTVDTPEVLPPKRPGDFYLACAPQLRTLDICCWAINVSSDMHAFPSLSYFRCWSSCPPDVSARVISLSRDTLEYLSISVSRALLPLDPISLPRLHTLSLDGFPFTFGPETLSFPCLSTLCLSDDTSPALPSFLAHIETKVTRLELFGDDFWGPDSLGVLKHLSQVTHLSFVPCADNSACEVTDAFFRRLGDMSPVVWPKLRSIRLSSKAIVSPAPGEGILHLLTRRNLERGLDDANAACPIEEFILESVDTPASLSAQVARILLSAST